MSEFRVHSIGPVAEAAETQPLPPETPTLVRYGLAVLLVAVAAVLAFVVEHLVAAPNLTLIFVLPVVIAAVAFGWGPSLTAAIGGVLAFDFFFTQPYYSLRIESPSDIWAAALLLVIAAIVSSVAAESRRRSLEARQAAVQAVALQNLAHLVIEHRPEWEVMRDAAAALHQAFRAPAVILVKHGDSFAPVASAGGAKLTDKDREAALGALETKIATRGGAYPYDAAEFDFWPVLTRGNAAWVMGVNFLQARGGRPVAPEQFIDVVRGYIVAAVHAAGGA